MDRFHSTRASFRIQDYGCISIAPLYLSFSSVGIVQRLREIKIWIGFNPGCTIIWILDFPASRAAASINVFEASDTGFTFLASPPLYVSAGKRESSNFCLEWSKTFQILLSLDLLIIKLQTAIQSSTTKFGGYSNLTTTKVRL